MKRVLPNSESGFWRLLDGIAKIAVPLAIAYFASVQNHLVTTIQQRQGAQDLDVRVVGLAWDAILTGSPEQRQQALRVIEALRPELRARLAEAIASDPEQLPEVRNAAGSLARETGLGLLATYAIDVFYDAGNEADTKLAQRVKSLLQDGHIVSSVTLLPRVQKWLEAVVPPTGNEVRYEVETERIPGHALADLLQERLATATFNAQPVVTKTVGRLSVLIFSRYARPKPLEPE